MFSCNAVKEPKFFGGLAKDDMGNEKHNRKPVHRVVKNVILKFC